MFAYTIRETLELLRDPIRLGFSLFGTALLMLVFGFGISTDVNNLSFAVLDRDQTPESRAYLEELRGSTLFRRESAADRLCRSGEASARTETSRPRSKSLQASVATSSAAGRFRSARLVDGAMPFRAQTIRGYLQGMHQLYLADPGVKTTHRRRPPPADIEIRFKYNQDFDSIYAMVPATMSLLLALFPAILMALAIVREKELGSITNLYVTPVTRMEFLLGKQLPYIAVAMINFALMFLMALFLFQVPLKGSFLALLLGALIYVTTTTAYGMLISAFTRTQIAALFGTAILTVLPATQFSGMMTPVASLSGGAQIMGRAFPNEPLRADQRRHLHQGSWLRRPGSGPCGAGALHSDPAPAEPPAAAQAGAVDAASSPTSSGLAPRNCAASRMISCCWAWWSMRSPSPFSCRRGVMRRS